MNDQRLNRIKEGMKTRGLSQMIISDPVSIYYILGKWIFPGERFHVLYISTAGDDRFIINKLLPQEEDLGVSITYYDDTEDGCEVLAGYTDRNAVIGVDKNWPSRFLLRLQELEAAAGYTNGSVIVDKVRQVKDETERQLMKESGAMLDRVMGKLIPWVVRGLTEKELSEKCLELIREEGFEGPSFEPITAYARGAADPHHITNDNKGRHGDCVILDIGGRWKNYCSDMTRTVFIGEVSERQREIYNIVLEANRRGIAAARPGARMSDVDKAARDYITEMGYGDHFTHRTGHSIGLETHETGDASAVNHEIIEAGQCFSVEPGIYLPDEGIGVRIEDIVLVTDDGCQRLNNYPKEDIIVVPDGE